MITITEEVTCDHCHKTLPQDEYAMWISATFKARCRGSQPGREGLPIDPLEWAHDLCCACFEELGNWIKSAP